MTYLITFCCYGSRVPGEPGATYRHDNHIGSPMMPENPALVVSARKSMVNVALQLDSSQREVVLKSIEEVCRHRVWMLLAAHVRIAHVHVVVAADCRPELAMNAFKSYASRALIRQQQGSRTRRWARHGSTVYLWTPDSVIRAIRYVIEKQGEPMAVFAGELPRYVSSLTVGVP